MSSSPEADAETIAVPATIADASVPTWYRVFTQDFRGWTPFAGQKRPPVQISDFPSRESALAFRATLPVDELFVATMTPRPEVETPQRTRRGRRD